MSAFEYGTICMISLLISSIAVGAVMSPLKPLLTEVCGTEVRAKFWTFYAGLLIYCVPLFLVTFPGVYTQRAGEVVGFGVLIQKGMFLTLSGIIVSLLILGGVMLKYVVAGNTVGRATVSDNGVQK